MADESKGGLIMTEWKGPKPTTVEAIPYFDGTSDQAKLRVQQNGEWVVYVRESNGERGSAGTPKD